MAPTSWRIRGPCWSGKPLTSRSGASAAVISRCGQGLSERGMESEHEQRPPQRGPPDESGRSPASGRPGLRRQRDALGHVADGTTIRGHRRPVTYGEDLVRGAAPGRLRPHRCRRQRLVRAHRSRGAAGQPPCSAAEPRNRGSGPAHHGWLRWAPGASRRPGRHPGP